MAEADDAEDADDEEADEVEDGRLAEEGEAVEADVTVGNSPSRLATTLAATEKSESTLDLICALEALATDARLATTEAAWLNSSLTTDWMTERESADA